MRQISSMAEKCAEAAYAQGEKIVLEIHNNSLVETVESGLRLVNMVGAGSIGLIHDAGNMYITHTIMEENRSFKCAADHQPLFDEETGYSGRLTQDHKTEGLLRTVRKT
ncbi:hypothetical protein FE783_31500 [Paenibacillus mesophilus]|nr:hypothetical protein FE783_31500 [Paenibacillus mesophilus]